MRERNTHRKASGIEMPKGDDDLERCMRLSASGTCIFKDAGDSSSVCV